MFKESVICIVIVIMIVGLDIFTQGYTNKSIENISGELSNLKPEILDGNTKNVEDKLKDLEENWVKIHDKLAYYIEHDELEKVDTAMVQMKSYIETKDYSSAIAELESGKFILEHIEEKNSFNLQNIF